MDRKLFEKYEKLKSLIGSCESAAAAFSGGVDSAFLLYAAKEALGENLIAVTAAAASFPGRELREAEAFCNHLGVRQAVVEFDEMRVPGFSENPANRCYLCKKALFEKIREEADRAGVKEVLEGSNLDDLGDYRPGLQAIAELGVKSPLREAGFTKQEIRTLSGYFSLPTWNKQSFACLATRFPYGDPITEEKLGMVDRAEQLLLDLGFRQLRVRVHGNLARIELEPAEFDRFMREDVRKEVYGKFKELGFTYVALDLLGYRTGSMNEPILQL